MALTNSQYDSIMKQYQSRRSNREDELDRRKTYIEKNIPKYDELNRAIRSLRVKQASLSIEGAETDILSVKNEIAKLIQERDALLSAHNLPADYLNVPYVCPDCNDTGYADGKKCHCFKQEMLSLLFDQSNIRDFLSGLDFSQAKDSYYHGEDLTYFHDSFEKSVHFVENFSRDYQNLLFYGTVGTGKSFLSGCIAKSLIEKGHSVVYFSATSLMDTLSKIAYDYRNKESYLENNHDIYSCDLLIIDDLGTEFTNDYSVSKLFHCLNERFTRQKSTIISTNLSLSELRDRYSDRIFSRISGNFILCRMTGPDIRMLKR